MRINLMKERHLKPTMLLCRRVAEVIGLKELWLVEWRKGDYLFGGAEGLLNGKTLRIRWGLYENRGGVPVFKYQATWSHVGYQAEAIISAAQLLDESQRKRFADEVGGSLCDHLNRNEKEVDGTIKSGSWEDDPDIKLADVERQIKLLGGRTDD